MLFKQVITLSFFLITLRNKNLWNIYVISICKVNFRLISISDKGLWAISSIYLN